MQLTVMKNTYAICKLDHDSPIPPWVHASHGFASMTYTPDELSIVCQEKYVPAGIKQERGWRILKIIGPLDFSLVGVISRITGILANAGVSLFTVSTYETDFILVKKEALDQAIQALKDAGLDIID
ncbi:MAG: ACT domain-containing protein [Bacteroidota bacterium]